MDRIPDNILAVFVIVLGLSAGFYAAHVGSKELLAFGSGVAGYGAAWFQSSKKAA